MFFYPKVPISLQVNSSSFLLKLMVMTTKRWSWSSSYSLRSSDLTSRWQNYCTLSRIPEFLPQHFICRGIVLLSSSPNLEVSTWLFPSSSMFLSSFSRTVESIWNQHTDIKFHKTPMIDNMIIYMLYTKGTMVPWKGMGLNYHLLVSQAPVSLVCHPTSTSSGPALMERAQHGLGHQVRE